MGRSGGFLAVFVLMAGSVFGQTVTVTQPAGGETWVRGSTHTITWTKSGTMPGFVRITLRNASTLAETNVVIDPAPNSGSYVWTIAADIADGSYMVRVRVKGANIADDSNAFTIGGGPQVIKAEPRTAPVGEIALKFPALAIYQAGMVAYDDKFEVTFGYKNTGAGPLPKSSEMPVRPNFRVFVDGREVNHGDLFIPAFPAPPGWQVPTFSACSIARQTSGSFDTSVYPGNELRVTINENKVNGMATSTQIYSLRAMGLNYTYDLLINDVTLDWNSGVLTALVRLDGVFRPNDEIELWDENIFHFPGYDWWHMTAKAQPGQHLYTLSRKRDGLKGQNDHKVALRVVLKRSSDPVLLYKDLDHRNNQYDRVFHR